MNSQELLNLLRQVLTLVGGLLAGAGLMSNATASAAINDIMVIIPAAISLGSLVWSVYAHWKMVKVPAQTKVVTGAGNVAASTALKSGMVAVALALAAALMVPQAHAASKAAPAPAAQPLCGLDILKLVPGCRQQDGTVFSASVVWQNLKKAAATDLIYAKGLADAAATPDSALRSACYAAIIKANQAVNGPIKDAQGNDLTEPQPPANVITLAEQGAELVDQLQPTSPVMAGCAAAAQALKVNGLALVNAIATGALVKAATGGAL